MIEIKSCIPWVGGKGQLLWLIDRLLPPCCERFIDVFGGSGTVTFNRPMIRGVLQVYNDFNSDLVNLFFCVKNRPLALVKELSFLPLHSRDDFNVLCKFFAQEEFKDGYLEEELHLSQQYLSPPDAEIICRLMTERAERGDVCRAAAYFKLIRESFCGGGKAFAGKECDLRRFFYSIWECSRRLADVVLENKDFEALFQQYDREGAVFYCDPPYYDAEDCYDAPFGEDDHIRLRDTVLHAQGCVMVSYNYCPQVMELYRENFYIFYTTRHNSMSQKAGSLYEEVVITNYDPREFDMVQIHQLTLFGLNAEDQEEGRYSIISEPTDKTFIRRILK